MYNREHVTIYLLSPEPVVGFRVEVPRCKLYKLFPFSIKTRCSVAEVDEPAGKPETTQVRARSKLNAKLKTHVLGVNHAETAGSVRFMAVYIFLSISHPQNMYSRILRLTNDRQDHCKNISNEF